MPQTLEQYLDLPYHLELVRDRWEDGTLGWFVRVVELPGCMSQGATPGEAVDNIRDAMAGVISVMLEDGQEVPLPAEEPQYSGKFLVRLPRTLHGELVRTADREGVSLNQFVSGCLAAAVQWRFAPAPTHV